jgi:beta-galactosidase
MGPIVRAALLAVALTAWSPGGAWAQAGLPVAKVVQDAGGQRLQVDGRDVFVKGVNWDYFPIGTNYSFSLWAQPDDIVQEALDREMGMLRVMGVNAIRVYNGMPARWVRYVYEKHGIWTVLNHPLGRYGLTVDGTWMPLTDYSSPRVRQLILDEVAATVAEYKDTPGILLWLLGNENNYGLEWRSAATENLPVGERQTAKARYLYSLYGEAVQRIKGMDPRPVAMANGDLQYLEIIAEEVKGLDIFGSNVYRGASFRDFFDRVKATLDVPVLFTEFGADAYNAKDEREDQTTQATVVLAQWEEIYANAAGKGLAGNAIGGLTFQWSDGWWKYGQETGLDVHDVNASWANDAYPADFVRGQNNMNEEWWGIVAKGPANSRYQFELYPRALFYGLQQVNALDPYEPGLDRAMIARHFARINVAELALKARADKAAMGGETAKLRVRGLRMELQSIQTGGSRITTPRDGGAVSTSYPAFRGFDRMESFYADFEARPTERLRANVSFNVLGSVAENPIDEIFYENRGRARLVRTTTGDQLQNDIERLRVYQASVTWDTPDFKLEGFNRTGHYHWGYEGDFFGIYREANYGRNIDIYNGDAPLGVEFTGKRQLEGVKVAVGPELWWGANPAALLKLRRTVRGITLTGLFQEDIARNNPAAAQSSFAIPIPQARRATLHAATTVKGVGVELGGIWSGGSRVGQTFQLVEGSPGDYTVLEDRINGSDQLGVKAKVTYSKGRVNWYAQAAQMGLIADGGPTSVQTFTGWWLKDTGLNNQWNVMSGFTFTQGNLQIAPNVLYQAPIVGPIPDDAPAPARKRNIIDDPFAVRGNREMLGAELLLTWDPTPATWMHQWDNDMQEDADFAASLGYVHRSFATTQDAAIGILADGRTTFAFPGATPARDLWEVRARVIKRLGLQTRFILNAYRGTAEPNGDSQRLVDRFGSDLRLVHKQFKVVGAARLNDFGPFDYHRDFNLTFPAQYSLDLSYALAKPQWWDIPETKFGVRGTWRSLDRYSPRYCPTQTPDALGNAVCDPLAPGFAAGREWELRSYLIVAW